MICYNDDLNSDQLKHEKETTRIHRSSNTWRG